MKMNNMGAQAVLAVLLLIIGTVKANEASVEFWGDTIKMTCPEEAEWFKKTNNGNTSVENGTEFEQKYDRKNEGEYYCQYKSNSDSKYYFYVKGKGCANCFELDPSLMILAIILDVIWTVFVMMMIYWCTKKKSPPAPQTSKAPARSGGRAPPVPSPDYEQLSPQTRAQDPYSFLNRTG